LFIVISLVYFKMSSPYLYVCDDDHVTCYMGADVDAGG